MIDRRSLLKLFGAGATIAPVLAGVPKIEAQALIVKPPKVELAPEPEVVLADRLPSLGGMDVTVFMRNRETGEQYRMKCQAFVADWGRDMIEVTMPGDLTPRFLPGLHNVTLRATGEVEVVRTGGRKTVTSYV